MIDKFSWQGFQQGEGSINHRANFPFKNSVTTQTKESFVQECQITCALWESLNKKIQSIGQWSLCFFGGEGAQCFSTNLLHPLSIRS